MSLIARGLEEAGIPSVQVSVMPFISDMARPPRQVVRRLNIGATVGRPHDVEGQSATLRRMVALLESAQAPGAVDKDEKSSD